MTQYLKFNLIWLLVLFCANVYGQTPTINASTTSGTNTNNELIIPASSNFLLSIQYSGTNTLNAFTFRTYFNSNKLVFSTVANILQNQFQTSTSIVDDTNNADSDDNTDKRFGYSWGNSTSNWPVADANSLPIELFQVSFLSSQNIFTDNSTINFSDNNNTEGGFASTPVVITNTPEILTGNNQVITTGATLTPITLYYGNNTVSVTFYASNATFADTGISSTTINTVNGFVTAPSITVATISNDYQIIVSSLGFVTQTINYNVQAGIVNATQSIITSSTTANITVGSPVTFTLSIRDENGNEVNNVIPASITTSSPRLTGSSWEVSSILAGSINVVYTSGTEAGTESLAIFFDGIQIGTSIIITSIPPIPNITTTAQTSSTINILWAINTAGTGYYIIYSATQSNSYNEIASNTVANFTIGSTLSYIHMGLSPSTTYKYQLRVCIDSNISTCSASSVISIATTKATFSLDVDNNGITNINDGLLILRFLAGSSNENLVYNLVDAASATRNATMIKTYLINAITILDVDNNGIADAATDGFLIIRYLLDIRDNNLIISIIGSSATRKTVTEIIYYLNQFKSTDL